MGLNQSNRVRSHHHDERYYLKAEVDAAIGAVSGGGLDAEGVRDTIGAALVAGAAVTITPNDVGDTITIAIDTAAIDERARDALAVALTAGSGITITPNDGSDTITIASSITQYTDEMARDALGAALVAGSGVTITPNDGADTITIAATAGGSGDVVGPATATDGAFARFNGATGELIQDSRMIGDGDGRITTKINSDACQGVVASEHWIKLSADYVLTNTAAEQKIFNTTANGRLTLPTGTYFFDCMLLCTGMSGTNGNFSFDPIGAGTAAATTFLWNALGIDASTPSFGIGAGGTFHVTQQSAGNVVTATTGTGAGVVISGSFRIDTAGTIIPSISLTTAVAATLRAGSHFRIWRAADHNTHSVGAWD